MIITKIADGFEIRGRNANTSLTVSEIKINGYVISQPGEYDVSGVSAEVLDIGTAVNAFIDIEGVLTSSLTVSLDLNSLSEDITKVSILLLFVEGEGASKKITEIVSRIEPQLVFYQLPEDFNVEEIANLEKMEKNYKIGKLDLDFEGTRSIQII